MLGKSCKKIFKNVVGTYYSKLFLADRAKTAVNSSGFKMMNYIVLQMPTLQCTIII